MHHLDYFGSGELWKGEMHFISRRADARVAKVSIIQRTGRVDVLDVRWRTELLGQVERLVLSAWLRAGACEGSPPTALCADQVVWSWSHGGLRVRLAGIEHVFPEGALDDLRLLAVR